METNEEVLIDQNKVNSIINALESQENKKTAVSTGIDTDVKFKVRDAVGEFIVSMMDKLNQEDGMESLILTKLTEKITNDELSISQLTQLLNQITNRKGMFTSSIFAFLKPDKDSTSPLLDTDKYNDGESEMINNLTSDQLKALQKLYHVIAAQDKEENERIVNEDKD